jgi:polar amino acid transport system substrate-binding protein
MMAPVLGSATALVPTLAFGQGDTIERIKKRGYIVAGFFNEKPAAFVDENRKLTGVFPAVARPILEKDLGITEIQAVLTQWQSLIPGLQAERFDFIIAGMFILPERCREVLFTDPFSCSTEALVFRKDSSPGVKSYQDLAAKPAVRVGLVPGSSQAKYANAVGLPASRVQNYPDPLSGLEALKAGRIDVWAGPTDGVKAIFELPAFDKTGLDMVSFVPEINGKKQLGCGGFAFRKADTGLRDVFNKRIREWKRSGELYGLVKEWVPRDEFDAGLSVTAEQLCSA